MAIAKITGQGLTLIALMVALLWGCIIGEQVIVRKANFEYYRALRDVQLMQMKKRAEPASAPAPKPPRPARPTFG